jgi:CheY-like chemotaxis protein
MSYTLLLADDSVTTHRVIELTFAGQDIRVVSVADGEQALERMRTLRPDILLVEAALPRVDGYQLAEHVRRTPELAGVPVLLLSGAFDVVDEPRVRAAGAVGTLVKPFEPEAVINRVKELLGISRKGDPAPQAGRLVTPAAPPPREAHIPTPSAAWDELRQQQGLAPDTADVEGPKSGEADYRDNLDETFASLDAQLSGSGARHPAARPAPRATATPPPIAPPVDLAVEPPVYEVDRDWFADPPEALEAEPIAPEHDTTPGAPDLPWHRTAPAAPGAPLAPVAPGRVADAFEALLAGEQSVPVARPAPVGVSDAVVDRIATRVAEQLSEGVFIDIVTQIVTVVAERLVREEIGRIRAKAEEREG